MKILLINPSKREIYGKAISYEYPPLGLAYIGAVLLQAGHKVRMIDIDADGISDNDFLNILKENYQLIGLTATTPSFKEAASLSKTIKENCSTTILLGGIHATILPEDCIKIETIDIVLRGEGEATISELVDVLENNKSLADIDGITYRDNNEIKHNPNRAHIKDLDTIPFPARHLFNYERYTFPDALSSPAMPIITSRGCPHKCTFCCTKLIFDGAMRFRSVNNVVDEIEQLVKDYGAKEIHIWDDNYTVNKKRVFAIHQELKRRNIKLNFAFPNGIRVDQIDKEILQCLKEMGVYYVGFGVESGNQIILNNVKKATTLKQIEDAYILSKKFGFETWGNIVFGLPGETEETIKNTISFIKKVNPDIVKFHVLKPYPGTEVFHQLKDENLITEYDYSKYGINTKPVHRIPGLSSESLVKWQNKAYRQFYFRPSKILGLLLRIKSRHRLKLVMRASANIFNFLNVIRSDSDTKK